MAARRGRGSRAHWRTREYFPAGTKVHVDAKLYGVPFGDGAYGAQIRRWLQDRPPPGGQGRASSHRIQVLDAEARLIMDFPCSYGEGDLPRNVTRSGIHVVTEKYEDFYMTNPAAGYGDVRERFAVRISNNGEFIHANPDSSGAQGNTNVTNGCINLSLKTPSSTSTARSTATPSRSPAPVSCPTPTATSGTGPSPWDEWDVDVGGRRSAAAPTFPARAPATPSDAPTLSVTRRREASLDSQVG